ncbi:T-cell differentiation antigen CD6 isoform X2 [Coregonus clupeaformis]|uniref:T-cell differentiation antigen CD6 isoform X2 n=1 Tax=Coregonus clupeaformis TaxID=59861 RepID=UPI001BE0F606|nr:T-cell differentiation antigen CD6 isoform X2 [Coregonus clupeaformis]
MKLVKLILILQALHLCQAYNNSSAQTGKNASQSELDNNQTEPYITQRSNACSWSPMIFRDEIWTSVTFTAESRDQVAHQICMALGCGGVYSLNETSAPPNSICLTNCTYREYRLQNCSHVVRMNCTKVSDVVCGHQAVRLAGGEHRCAGRVELWREGQQWGTVCDDEWDMRDADVVCAQLGCGYAISVTGQGGAFPQGKDPIYLDELKCTGKEGNLWQCPASDKSHDCGHKEDAGVVCSELKAVRLTGGVDHCSGKVEIHRNGSWGTVCDNCWGKEEASMVCSMLGCGEPVHFVAFKPPFTHNNGTLWYYRCDPHHTDLWQCKEFANITILCTDSEAAGLICSGSRGRYLPVTTEAAATVLSRTPVTTASVANYGFPFAMSLELLGCISLSFLLLTALVTNALLCCHYRRRNALLVQQRHANLQTPTEHHDKDYQDSVNLIKVTTSSPTENEVPANPRYQWTQSSVDSTSVDTDYDQCDLNAEAAVHMTTFQNSIRYKQDTRNPFMRATALDSLSEEAHAGDNHNVFIGGICDQAPGCNIGPPSVDSFDSSSTSSEECYENTGRMDPWQPPVTHNANNHLMPSGNPDQTQSHDQGVADGKSDEYEEEGHLYSPDPNQSSSEGVYDDIANYLDSNPEQGY